MATKDLAGKVQTVLGPINPDRLGVTLTHEHLLIDLSVVMKPKDRATDKDFYNKPVSLETAGQIRHYGTSNADDMRLFDIPTAIEEVMLYKQYGGVSLVDATSVGISRDPIGLARISRAIGVNVVMGSSYYVAITHPPGMDHREADEIVEEIVRDMTEGVDGTNIKAGVIGEVGCSWPLAENERKVLRASAKAQRLTGASLLIHPGRDETAPLEIIEVLSEAGADLSRTIMGHLDRTVFLRDTLKKIAGAGCYMEWDLFGQENSHYPPNPKIDMPSDAKRMDDIAWIASEGYNRKILVAHDICAKHRLQKYGGHGYSYILANIVPRMRTRGFTEEAIEQILINNPRDALTFSESESG
jgi:phosphotriesterase-related protein